MADVVIFGVGDYALQAHYYLTTDSPHRVAGFSVTSEWCTQSRFLDLPLIPFEEVEATFPPNSLQIFSADERAQDEPGSRALLS